MDEEAYLNYTLSTKVYDRYEEDLILGKISYHVVVHLPKQENPIPKIRIGFYQRRF